jgi:hypothetical protein
MPNPVTPLKYIAIICLLFYASLLHAQTNSLYTYQQLSNVFYAKQKDSIKKAWTCPELYKNKATQKKYKEIWDSRTDFIAGAIDDQNYIYEPELYSYIQGILGQIAEANPEQLPVRPFLLVDRSSSANAYAIGGNIIAVNLGLIDFAQSREEIAFVLAHELSHNILNHIENMMKERAEWLTSDDYKNSLNAVLDSKYERFSRLKKILEGYSFNRSKHQRYHESDADSLAIVLLQKSKIPFDAGFFLRLDSADLQYKHPLKNPLKDYFTAYNLPFEDAWAQRRTKGLSTRNYSFRDTTGLEDSLKTHPDCIERYNKTKALTTPGITLTAIPPAIKAKATKMLIWNIFDNMGLTACLYRVLLEKDKGNQDGWYDFMVHNIFTGLNYNDRQLQRFIAIGITQKEYISKDYYGLQNMLEQMPKESLDQYCRGLQQASFWNGLPPDAHAFKSLMYALAIEADTSDKTKFNASKEFTDNNATSMYCEFANHFKKK